MATSVVLAACVAAPSSNPSQTTTSAASVGGSPAQVMPGRGDLFPGTYEPRFQPRITFTVGDAVNLDCAPNYECRGEVDVDEPAWVAVDFGHDHGSELLIMRIDEIAGGTPPPADLAFWIAALPGLTMHAGPTEVTVGGLPASRLVFETGDAPVEVGPIPGIDDIGAGFPPNDHRLAYVVDVRGHWVLISVGFDADNIVRNFEETVAAIQPIIDSITWP